MGGDALGVFQGAAVFEVSGDAGGAEGVTADSWGEADVFGTTFDHSQNIGPVQAAISEVTLAGDRAEQRRCFGLCC